MGALVGDGGLTRWSEESSGADARAGHAGLFRTSPEPFPPLARASLTYAAGFNTTFVHPSLRSSKFLYASGAWLSGSSCETMNEG